MSRLPLLRPDELDSRQREIYSGITEGPRAQGPQHFSLTHPDGSLVGPFNALLFSAGVGGAVQELGAAVRYATSFTARTRELAILVVAARWDSGFERMAHEAVGLAVGLTPEEIDSVRAGGVPALANAHESACVTLAHAMAAGDVDDEQWAAARAVLSDAEIVELSVLVGYYAMLALQLRVFRVEATG